MEMCSNESHNEFVQNNSTNLSDYHEIEGIDFTQLLEETEKTDDLEALDEIEQIVLAAKQKMVQAINMISCRTDELNDELNKTKCFIKELDQLHSDTLEKNENLRENIELKKLEALQEQNQQLEDLDQFELDVFKISTKFVTAPKEYEKNNLNEKIENMKNVMGKKKGMLKQQMEKLNMEVDSFQKTKIQPMQSISVAITIFDDTISGKSSSKSNMIKSIDKMSKEIEKLRFDMKTYSISKLNFGIISS